MIATLVVEDSSTIRQYLSALIEADSVLELVGTAVDGLDAVAKVKSLQPQVVIMDIEMPNLDGIEATRRIMAENPVPIVVCSANLNQNLTEKSYRAIAAGALMVVAKPKGPGAPGAQVMIDNLLRKVRLMADVKVVRHQSLASLSNLSTVENLQIDHNLLRGLTNCSPELVAIGASTGGPPVLATILTNLRVDFPLPILVVQHIAPGFLEGMLNWLQSYTKLPLHVAEHGQRPLPGHIYFAPDDYHLEFASDNLLSLMSTPAEYNVKPAVANLFRSLARPDAPAAAGVLLTGMGRDGARELLAMRERGQITIAQDEASSVINGMPGEAARLSAVQARLNPLAIAEFLNQLS